VSASRYNIKPTTTVLCVPPMRARLETPFQRELGLSNTDARMRVLARLLELYVRRSGTLQPGFRNEFHAGLQQAFGKRVMVSASIYGKYTHNAFDSACWATRLLPSPSTGKLEDSGFMLCRADIRSSINFQCLFRCVSCVGAFYPPQVPEPELPSARPVCPSASTTTRNSTSPPTCIHVLREARCWRPVGEASIGVTTRHGGWRNSCYTASTTPTAHAATSTTAQWTPAVESKWVGPPTRSFRPDLPVTA